MELSKFESPWCCYIPQFCRQQLQSLPTRLVFLWQDKQFKTTKDPRTHMLYSEYTSSYEDLLSNTGLSTLLLNRLNVCFWKLKFTWRTNTECIYYIFKTHVVPYDLRTTNLVQPKCQSNTYGVRFFSYIGSRLWNEGLSFLTWNWLYWF